MGTDRSVAAASIGGLLGGVAAGAATWMLALVAVDSPTDLNLENWVASGIWLIGVLLLVAVLSVVAFVAGTLAGTAVALRITGSRRIAVTIGVLLLAQIVVVPLAAWAVVSISTDIPLWLVLSPAAVLCGSVTPAVARHLVIDRL